MYNKKSPEIRFVICFVLATFLMLSNLNSIAGENNDDNDKLSEISEIISSKNYAFQANYVLPQWGSSRSLTRNYTLRVTDSISRAHLPYFGVVHSRARYGGNGGVKFDGEMFDYSKEIREEKREILVKFKVRGSNILYQCYLRVSEGGSATLHVNPDNRQSISYWGRVEPL